MKTAPMSILHSIAGHYHQDALDFLGRFDLLWEEQLHKTGRIKSFVDLLFACECTLKCHFVLQHVNDDARTTYKAVRKFGHDIEALAKATAYIPDHGRYAEIGKRLGPFSVFIRYSLDAYETFFPSAMDRNDAPIQYSKSIGNNPWVLDSRDLVATILAAPIEEFDGFVSDDIGAILQHEAEMKRFAEEVLF